MKVFACNAPYNEGGMGKHLAALVEEARSDGDLSYYYASTAKPNDPMGRAISLQHFRWLFRVPPFRYRHSWRDFLAADLFDRAVAQRLTVAELFTGFSGRAYHTFIRARKLKFNQIVLESATSHIAHVMHQHQKATKAYPLEESWLNSAQYHKTLREYDEADLIVVTSEYSWQTFLEAGIPPTKLRRRFLRVAPRFAPPQRGIQTHRFQVVYVGRLQVSKGLPTLLEAFRQLEDEDAQLTLVGGCATEGMERYLRQKLATDHRIKIRPGDPLPHLHRADVLVHPSFEDGLGLGPLEALACGVPAVVTQDTGMKEFIVDGYNGYIVPTGSVDSLVDCLRGIRSCPLKGTFEPFSPVENGNKRSV